MDLFFQIPFICSYYEYTFHPNRRVHLVSKFECDDVKISFYVIDLLEGVPLHFLPKLIYITNFTSE